MTNVLSLNESSNLLRYTYTPSFTANYLPGFSTSSIFPFDASLASPFTFNPTNFDYTGYLSFLTAMSTYNSYLSGQMPISKQATYFTKSYNTKTDIPVINKSYNPDLGNKLANIAEKNLTGGVGYCLQSVRKDTQEAGLTKGGAGSLGGAACEADDILAENKNFKKVSVSKDDLSKLPAGCIVVWNQSETGKRSRLSDKYGHIVITDGSGNGFSDHREALTETVSKYSGKWSVFVPIGSAKSIDAKA